ncbi:MAG: GSCFA domain-containing protein [Oceanihabitans sp.]
MILQTKIPLKKQERNLIDYSANVFLLGSCFSENIGDKFHYFKFQNAVNPFGILFHPIAIETLVANALDSKKYTEEDIFFNNEQWLCFDAHSKLSNASKETLLKQLNNSLKNTSQQITNAKHIIITLGTAWVYKNKETQKIVANCHKVPQKEFTKELLPVAVILDSLRCMVSKIKNVNSKAIIIFTVSPVRHVKDGFIENTQSKSHLITAIHQLLKEQSASNNEQSFYFPSFEILLDELRDYRFYKKDMIHPNETAIQYIWERFLDVWISQSAKSIMKEVEIIKKGLQHKAFNKESKAHQNFLKQLKERQDSLSKKVPHIKF